MAFRPRQWLDRRLRQQAGERWALIAAGAGTMPPGRLRALQDEGRTLRRDLERFLGRAQFRLDRMARAADAVNLPAGTDWHWRPSILSAPVTPSGIAAPESGTWLGPETSIWHDCDARAIILRQVPNRDAEDLAPLGLLLEAMGFRGSYLSIAIDLPGESLAGLSRDHVVRIDASLSVERPTSVYMRLNIGHGPNTDALLQHLGDLAPGDTAQRVLEYDLHYLDINEQRLEKMWLDLIFEAPQMNALRVRDLFLSRHPRAAI